MERSSERSAIASGSAGAAAFGLGADGTVLLSGSTVKDGVNTPLPPALGGPSFIASNASRVAIGTVTSLSPAEITPVSHTIGGAATTTDLGAPSGLTGGATFASPNDINDKGDILFRNQKQWWVKRAGSTEFKTLEIPDTYRVSGAIAIDAEGRVYLGATKEGAPTERVIGLVVNP